MKLELYVQQATTVDVDFSFPLYRSHLQGEYCIAGFKKTYWKFDSAHKVSIITEEMSQTTILTYDDDNIDWIKELANVDMIYGNGAYDIIPEKSYDAAMQRLIDKIVSS